MLGIEHDGEAAHLRDHLAQEFEPLCRKFGGHQRQASHVGVWPSKAFGKARRYRIDAERVDHRHWQGELVYQHIGCALGNNEVDRYPYQFSSKFWHALQIVVSITQHEDEVTALDGTD